jgi:hypothetical protein
MSEDAPDKPVPDTPVSDESVSGEPVSDAPVPDDSVRSIPRRHYRGRLRRFIVLLLLALLLGGGFLFFQRLETGKAKTSKPASATSALAITTATARPSNVAS